MVLASTLPIYFLRLADGFFFSGFTLTTARIRSSKFDFFSFVFNRQQLNKNRVEIQARFWLADCGLTARLSQNMNTNMDSGKLGENEIINLVACPNCNKELMLLPPNYPLYDIHCSGCSFRAQVKTNQCKPKNVVFGAGWDVIDKVLKSGFIVPPLFVNFKWREANEENQVIYFFPFVPKNYLQKYELSKRSQNAGSKRFNYVGLLGLPHFISFRKGNAAKQLLIKLEEKWLKKNRERFAL